MSFHKRLSFRRRGLFASGKFDPVQAGGHSRMPLWHKRFQTLFASRFLTKNEDWSWANGANGTFKMR